MSISVYQKRLLNWAIVLSCVAMTAILTLNYSVLIDYGKRYAAADFQVRPHYAVIASAVMLPIYVFLVRRIDFLDVITKKLSRFSIVAYAALTIILVLKIILDAQKNYDHLIAAMELIVQNDFLSSKGYKLLLLSLSLAASIGIFSFAAYTGNMLVEFFREFFSEIDVFERYYFVIASLACCSLICYVYARTDIPWNSLDVVYQTDTVFVTDHYFPVFSNGFDFDWDIGNGGIRHPLATLMTYPIHVVCMFLANLLSFVPNIRPLLYAFALAELQVICGIALKRMTQDYWTAVLFSVSFPFVFYTVFIEKYTLSVFMLIFFTYAVTHKKSTSLQKYFLVSGAGMMITSAYMGFFYGSRTKVWERIREYIGVGLAFLTTIVATGRIQYILNFPALIRHNDLMFYGGRLGTSAKEELAARAAAVAEAAVETVAAEPSFFSILTERINGFTHLISSCFIPADHAVFNTYQTYLSWPDLTEKMSWFGLIIFICLIAAMIRNFRSQKVWLFFHWIMLAFLELIVLGVNYKASPLFCQYFSWAVIALFVIGVNSFIKKPALRACIYIPLVLVMVYTNIVHMKVLMDFMLSYPLPV